ncbi:hypothetical protein L6452_04454 [Arctium lappa]|uniref:Uncharacterized protein n=1 Tax=Arctium lappa TaxID=4217 RepID=A0ACB9EDN8_ARCLA|nr:hypothetical protein L6452_04454 [Arctium lappa]
MAKIRRIENTLKFRLSMAAALFHDENPTTPPLRTLDFHPDRRATAYCFAVVIKGRNVIVNTTYSIPPPTTLRFKKLFQIHLYSSDIGKWKVCVESYSASHMHTSFQNGVNLNQAIHWTDFYTDAWCFKLDVEQLQKLALPVQVKSYRAVHRYYGECGGHLHLVERRHGESCLHG